MTNRNQKQTACALDFPEGLIGTRFPKRHVAGVAQRGFDVLDGAENRRLCSAEDESQTRWNSQTSHMECPFVFVPFFFVPLIELPVAQWWRVTMKVKGEKNTVLFVHGSTKGREKNTSCSVYFPPSSTFSCKETHTLNKRRK